MMCACRCSEQLVPLRDIITAWLLRLTVTDTADTVCAHTYSVTGGRFGEAARQLSTYPRKPLSHWDMRRNVQWPELPSP
jgi:hypothetical protein